MPSYVKHNQIYVPSGTEVAILCESSKGPSYWAILKDVVSMTNDTHVSMEQENYWSTDLLSVTPPTQKLFSIQLTIECYNAKYGTIKPKE